MSSTSETLIIVNLVITFLGNLISLLIPLATIWLKSIKKSSCWGSNVERVVSPTDRGGKELI
jgi:hypothetical protein